MENLKILMYKVRLKVAPYRLRECCRQGYTVVSCKSRNIIHEIWGRPCCLALRTSLLICPFQFFLDAWLVDFFSAHETDISDTTCHFLLQG